MKIDTLLNSSRLMIFETGVEDYEYYAHGTVFLCTYEGQLYAITAAHVIKNHDADAIRVMIHPEGRDFLPQNNQITLRTADEDETDHTDLAVFPIEQDMLEPNCFGDYPPFALTDALFRGKPPSGGMLIFRGFPKDQSGVEYDKQKIKLQPITLKGERVDSISMDHCHKVKLHDVSSCTTLNGFN